jgi:hypothetical protein
MSAVALVRKDDPRAALRAAIENAASVKADLAKRQASLEAATEHVVRAEQRLRTASAAVGQAREEHIERVANALGDGREPPSATSVQAARDAESEARDELDAARAAAEQIKSNIADLESDVSVANRARDRALAQFLEPTCRRLTAEVRERHEKFVCARTALLEVATATLFDTWSETYKEAHLAANQPDFRLHGDTASRSSATREQWETALKALRTDPDAALPAIDDMTAPSRVA